MFDRICETIGVTADEVQLRTDCEQAVLKGLLRALQSDEISIDDLKKLAQIYCEFKKHDVAREKNAVALIVGEARAEAAARTADAKAAEAESRAARRHTRADPRRREQEEVEAPFGRKPDGTPYTHAEFKIQLRKAVRDIYGIENFAPETANTS